MHRFRFSSLLNRSLLNFTTLIFIHWARCIPRKWAYLSRVAVEYSKSFHIHPLGSLLNFTKSHDNRADFRICQTDDQPPNFSKVSSIVLVYSKFSSGLTSENLYLSSSSSSLESTACILLHGIFNFVKVSSIVLMCFFSSVLQCVVVCCSVLQCVAVCYSSQHYNPYVQRI